jgi:PhzF family phenazine biosynthesis protein
MKLKLYQIDAFASQVFEGNPAAVVPLSYWLEDSLLQKIAAENNLSETAFYLAKDDSFEIRWFTPTTEVDLCGHATLAAAHVLFCHEDFSGPSVNFLSPRSGKLSVSQHGDLLQLDFPVDKLEKVENYESLLGGFNIKPKEVWKGKSDYLMVFEREEQLMQLKFDLVEISKIPARGVIVTAPGNKKDFVSRFFGPQCGVPEDPVTGSAHTSLTPYWAKVLGKTSLQARQVSSRGGDLSCTLSGERVLISGCSVTYLIGELNL